MPMTSNGLDPDPRSPDERSPDAKKEDGADQQAPVGGMRVRLVVVSRDAARDPDQEDDTS